MASQREDGFVEEEAYEGYAVLDPDGSKIGKVDEVFLGQQGTPEYFGVKIGMLGMSSTLVPAEATTVDHADASIVVNASKDQLKDAPGFDADETISPERESEVRAYWGMDAYSDYEERGTYGAVEPSTESTSDEARVVRSEEEAVVGKEWREAGRIRIRKHVVTEPYEVTVPKLREEVTVERVPADGATAGDIGEEGIEVPVMEEQVAVGKRTVAKEEVRVRKDLHEDEESVGTELQKEQLEVDDSTDTRAS